MQVITAFIEGQQYDSVHRALDELGLELLASHPAEIRSDHPMVETWRGSRRVVDRHSALRLEIPYDGGDAEGVATAIVAAGSPEGGHVRAVAWVTDIVASGQSSAADPARFAHPAAH
jgi:nitrogen regulatory protein PII